jgi:hypothetical protein
MSDIPTLQLQIIRSILNETDEKTLLTILGILTDLSVQTDRAIAVAMKAEEGRVILAVRILRSRVPGLSLKDARDAIIYHKRYQELKGI